MADRAAASVHLDPEVLATSVVLREDARLSADGERLTFTRHGPRSDGSSRPTVVLVDGLSSRASATVVGPGRWLARWSPDDTRLAMLRRERGAVVIGIRELGTGADTDVGAPFVAVTDMAWAPDGLRLAVIGTVRREGGALASPGAAALPGPAIVDGARGSTTWLSVEGEAAGVAWSPDGRYLAVRVRDADGYVARLELIDIAAGMTTATVGGPASRILGMTWSPDSRALVVLGAPDFSFHPGLHRYDLASGRLEPIVDEPEPFVADLGGWVEDGRLLVHGRERARSRLYLLDVATGRSDCLVDLGGRAWGLAMDAAGRRFASVRETATEPPVVIVGDVGAGTWHRLRDVGRALGDLGPAARPETLTVAAGDVALDAWVLPARGAAAASGGRHPAILMVHGGPHDDLGDEWDVGVGQVLAEHGFVVAWTNPRGSTSYGRAFTDAVRGDIGGAELDDLLAVTDALAVRPDVDAGRIGICGYSHGGFLAASAVTRTRRFAAAVCWAPFTDLLSEWGMSDEGRGWGRWVLGGDPTQAPERYRDRSPAWHVDRPIAPTLLIHGERDQRCPIGQSALFHALLQATGTTTRLVRLPDADHALFETPGHTAHVARETLAWFTTHLRPHETAA